MYFFRRETSFECFVIIIIIVVVFVVVVVIIVIYKIQTSWEKSKAINPKVPAGNRIR